LYFAETGPSKSLDSITGPARLPIKLEKQRR
jgi:hypothetical protein